ncbi:MAG: VPLPA-CTERM sorting domain-containing protein [Gammaproteobacteria bacterium]|nr:VPLPA-CTERM sorting domain-containing protein [Gammaproteobacteria bacterium]
MKVFGRIALAGMLAAVALTANAAPVVLDNTFSCTAGNAVNGITIGDVTGNAGGANECWGTFDGNDPGPSGDGFDVGGTIFNFVARENTPGLLEGTDIGLAVDPDTGDASAGNWSFDSSTFAPTGFLIVLKSASKPGFAAWLFDGPAAASDAGTWLVAWTNQNGVQHDLSHLSIYAPTPVPVPAAVWLFGSGLLGLVGVARRKNRPL